MWHRTIIIEAETTQVIHEPADAAHTTIEIIVRPRAHLEYHALHRAGHDTTTVRVARVEADASIHWNITVLGNTAEKIALTTTLIEPGASSITSATLVGTDDHVVTLDATSIHAAPHTESTIAIRGVFSDRSFGVWNGMTHIQPDAIGSRGHQTFAALLLSEAARIEPSPQLKIENDNVACSHAASIGHLDAEQLFYLMSRGYAESDARRCIIEGFMEPDRSPWNTEIRAAIAQCLCNSPS